MEHKRLSLSTICALALMCVMTTYAGPQATAQTETVLHTFRVLEDRGLLEVRPRSGFYIKFRNLSPEPLPQPLRLEASPVEVSKLRYQAFSLGNAKDVVPLGTAVPSPEILPATKLGRMISAIARSSASEIGGYTEPAGHPKLRRQLARRASDW